MQKIVMDFVASSRSRLGTGIFEGDELAVKTGGEMNRNQAHKAERYGHVPRSLFLYLKEKKITAKLEDSLTEYLILKLLWELLRDPKNKMSDEDRSWVSLSTINDGKEMEYVQVK